LADARLRDNYSQVRTPRLQTAIGRFTAAFSGPASIPVDVHCAEQSGAYPQLGEREWYRLHIAQSGIELWADTEWGVLHAVSTLRQLVTENHTLPLCEIEDEPRFPWRGLLIDVARHFMSVAALRRTLDGMAACKLNVLHLHLTDDQGFRFPSATLPLAGEQQYSVTQLRELVDYAALLGIRVIPEIDLPGHSTALLAAHPWLGSGTTQRTERFGVHEACLDPSREPVYAALGKLLAEVAEVFPDRYLHIGGDEVSPGWWRESPEIAAFMQAQGLADQQALQSYFVNRVAGMVRDLDRVPIGWDEILHEDLPKSVVVQNWRGASSRDRALSGGNPCIVSAPYYLDLFFPADVHYGFDPEAATSELLALEDRLLDDARLRHVAEGMRWTHQWRSEAGAVARGAVLGGEACLWAELVTEALLDLRLWTRLPAIAERLWSPAQLRDAEGMYQRLVPWLERLKRITAVDVFASFRQLMREAGVADSWIPLVELLEPVKWYARLLGEEALNARLAGSEMPLARPYSLSSPLNGVVDGLYPESFAVREVRQLCDLVSAGDLEARRRLAQLAGAWQQLAGQPGCLPELAPSARQLGLAGARLGAFLDGDADADATLAALQALNQPQGEYVLALVPMLCAWLEGAAR
jgi:hexosaminidase